MTLFLLILNLLFIVLASVRLGYCIGARTRKLPPEYVQAIYDEGRKAGAQQAVKALIDEQPEPLFRPRLVVNNGGDVA